MSYVVQESYDSRIPSSAGNGWPFVAIACHDTEGGQGRAGAFGTKQFFIDRADRNASYHEIWWYHENSDEFGVLKLVPTYRAAHSINPNQPPNGPYEPDKWVREILGSYWWNPNQAVYAVSIAGKVADVNRYAQNPKFLAHAHRRMMELWKELNLTKRAEHFRFQPSTRSDWGKNLMNALGGLVTSDRYTLPDTAVEQPMSIDIDKIKAVDPVIVRVARHANIRTEPRFVDEAIWMNTGDKDIEVKVVARYWGPEYPEGSDDHLWYVYVLNDGGLRFFHRSQSADRRKMVDPATIEAVNCDAKVAEAVAPLEATVNEQATVIAGLKTDLSAAVADAQAAGERASEAEALVAPAQALKDALRNFMG